MTKLLTAKEARELLENNAELDEFIKINIVPLIISCCNLGLDSCRYTLKNHFTVTCHGFTGDELELANRLNSLGYTTTYGSSGHLRFMYINW